MTGRQKLLIIEDSEYHWKMVQQTMREFIDVYPADIAEFEELKQLFTVVAKNEKNEVNFKALKERIDSECCTLALVDVNLLDNKEDNKTGLLIKEKIIDAYSTPVSFRLFTSYGESRNDLSKELYIRKFIDGEWNMPKVVREKVLQWLSTELNENLSKLQTTFDRKFIVEDEKWYSALKSKPLIDYFITSLFYVSFLGVCIVGIILFAIEALKAKDLIHLAEYSFLAFLPFIIAISFFVFYKKALRRFIVGEKDTEAPYDEAGRLMRLSKKLFISTLISYLFIKLIEFIAPADTSTVSINTTQIICIGSCIVVLIAYYAFLDKHKE